MGKRRIGAVLLAALCTFVVLLTMAAGHGVSQPTGGVTVLDNDNWLISWGHTTSNTIAPTEVAAITEVTPDGTAVFHRVYHESEANVQIPLNLP